jgi:hypothetical protein
MVYTKRQRLEILRGQLEAERSSFMDFWRDLSNYLLPTRARFTVTEANNGQRKNQKIIDSTASLALRTLRAGMMSGVTSPARPWFRLTAPDPDLSEVSSVKEWLHVVSQRMNTVFGKSNLYNVLPILYGDLGGFGTSCMYVEEDFEDVVRFHSFPIGSYMIAKDSKGKVNTFFREFRMTVRQLIEKFGQDEETGEIIWERFSTHVKNQYENGQLETWIDVCHVIYPNDEFNPNLLHSKYKRFASCYYETGGSGKTSYLTQGVDDDRYLSEKGYDYFPVFCPRWEVTGEDVYATECPGMTALGDVKALQLMHKRKAQAIEKMVNPPLVGPSALRNQKTSLLPGDVTYLDTAGNSQQLRPIHEVNFRINELLLDIEAHQNRIQRAFFEDLFLMLSQSNRREITAREIEERHEEKLLALGPVLEQLNQDLLDPLIDITFAIMLKRGHIPEPPEELQGVALRVEYISVMAQAQKLAGISGMERFASFVGQMVQLTGDTTVLDKIDSDQFIDRYADRLSVDPDIVRSDEKVAEIRQSRAQASQAAQTAEVIKQGAGTIKDLSQTDMSGDNALSRMIDGGAAQAALA